MAAVADRTSIWRTFLFLVFSALAGTLAAENPQSLDTPEGLSGEARVTQSVGTPTQFELNDTGTELGIALRYDSLAVPYYALLDFRARTDDRYNVGGALLNIPFYFLIREAGMGYAGNPLRLRAGTFRHTDVVQSPYSLFVSSRANSAPLYEIDYAGDWLRVLTRSVELNKNSGLGYPDRSMIFQTVAVRAARWEIGFQNATVAVGLPDEHGNQPSDGSGPVFVPEFFFSLLPSYLTQYIIGDGENPWVQRLDYKSLMGFYGRAEIAVGIDRPLVVEAQVLVDDFNANAIFDPDNPHQNPFMGAWMLSGQLSTRAGRFRLSHAGALQYTFQTSGDFRYSYTYYPEVAYPLDGGWQAFDYRDNYIGFYLGENTLAFRVDWDLVRPLQHTRLRELTLAATGEYTASGSKSPHNSWGDYASWTDHGGEGVFGSTRLLDETPLEHGFRLGASASVMSPLPAGDLHFRIAADLGLWVNVLKLDPDRSSGTPAPHEMEIYRPSDENYVNARVKLEARYAFARY